MFITDQVSASRLKVKYLPFGVEEEIPKAMSINLKKLFMTNLKGPIWEGKETDVG